ncbi:MAG: DUF222 domain-containing protein, partial [Jatrophihabitantaceae bacterium]
MGAVVTVESQPDEAAHWAGVAPLTEGVLTPFGVIDPQRLSQDGCLDLLVGLERVKAWADAQQARVLARLAARPDPAPAPARDRDLAAQLSMREEVACALRWTFAAAAERTDNATELVGRLPATLTLLEDGRIPYVHARTMVRAVRDLDDSAAAQVEQRVLSRAADQTPAEMRRATARAVAAVDPRGQDDKHEAAAAQRRVAYQPDEDAMAWINAYLPAADAQTVMAAVNGIAEKRGRDERTADQRRADALVAICDTALRGDRVDGPPQWQGRRPNVQVSVALSTLAGLDDQPGELDGYGPIPAGLARRIAADPTGTWRRLVTDERGRLVDYGRTRYRPPADLREFVIARDRTCRGIGCHRNARRCDLDHVHDWTTGGDTTAANLEPKCRRDHHLKHDAGWRSERLPDGTSRWTSPTGRVYDKAPERHPVDRTRAPVTDPPAILRWGTFGQGVQ